MMLKLCTALMNPFLCNMFAKSGEPVFTSSPDVTVYDTPHGHGDRPCSDSQTDYRSHWTYFAGDRPQLSLAPTYQTRLLHQHRQHSYESVCTRR
jgi:hypothetical protein